MSDTKIPVQFIKCNSGQIQELISKNEIKNSLSLAEDQKEPEENPIENLIKELERI